MDFQWVLILKNMGIIVVVTAVYSYTVVGFVGIITGFKTKGDKAIIDQNIEKFIISPFYVATLFSLLSVLFFWRGTLIMHQVQHLRHWHMLILGLMVFVAFILLEVVESFITYKNPLRILDDKDAMHLFAIYLGNILMICIITFFV